MQHPALDLLPLAVCLLAAFLAAPDIARACRSSLRGGSYGTGSAQALLVLLLLAATLLTAARVAQWATTVARSFL